MTVIILCLMASFVSSGSKIGKASKAHCIYWRLLLLFCCCCLKLKLEHSYRESRVEVKSPLESSIRDPVESALLPLEPLKLEPFELEQLSLPQANNDAESDWTYERLRDAVAEVNNGFFEYADRLSSQIKFNFMFRSKFLTCNTKANGKELQKRHSIQDKINLQEALEDLQAKYDALEQALEKIEDINEDNKEAISRLRAHRDRCVQSNANRKKNVDSLRDEATELRRQISHARSQSG